MKPSKGESRVSVKRVLLVGSSFSALPLLQKCRQRQLHISVCGAYQDDPGHALADASFTVNYADKEALLELAQSQSFDYIVPSCNDYSYLSSSWVANQLGLPGFDAYETSRMLHTKDAFRAFFADSNVPMPKHSFVSSDNLNHSLSYPALCKPVDSFSGRGVSEVHSDAELADALEHASSNSRSASALLEELVDGRLYSHSAFISKGQILIDFFADEFCTVHPYQVNCSNIPSSLNEHHRHAVRQSIRQIIETLKLSDGLLHTQFIADDKEHWIIECMRRCPGDLYGRMVELATGVNYTDLLVRPYLAEAMPESVEIQQHNYVGRHTISSGVDRTYLGFTDQLPGHSLGFVPLKNSGEKLAPAPYDKSGILFKAFDTEQDMLEYSPVMADFVALQDMECMQ
jgi:biotin carboxylase